jgi:sugar O-acyltransferase (sialic acid O-acetyltransferase NeuD family)
VAADAEKHLLVIGAGGHGKVAADCARAAGLWFDISMLDDRWPQLERSGDWAVVGRADALHEQHPDAEFFVGIGDGSDRLRILKQLLAAERRVTTIIHPRATVSPDTFVGTGSLVVAGAVVNAGVRMGVGCVVNTCASVDHDCWLGEGVHICPGTHLAGNVRIGDGSWVGIGSVITEGVQVGHRVTVGAGAVVVHDVTDGLVVVGAPARPIQKR